MPAPDDRRAHRLAVALARTRRRLTALHARVGELEGQVAWFRHELEVQQSATNHQVHVLTAERDHLEARLLAFERTAAVRWARRWWAFSRRLRHLLAPADTRAPEIPADSPLPVASGVLAESRAPRAPDIADELAAFTRRVEDSGARRVAMVLSPTRLDDAEGQCPGNLARELARRGIPVVFACWRGQPTERYTQSEIGNGIVQVPIDLAIEHPELVAERFVDSERILLVEFPYPHIFGFLAAARGAGWIVVYDVPEDWQELHGAGEASWYDPAFERHLAASCDAAFAAHERLAARVRELGAPDVEVVGKGMRSGVEACDAPRVDAMLATLASGRQRVALQRRVFGSSP